MMAVALAGPRHTGLSKIAEEAGLNIASNLRGRDKGVDAASLFIGAIITVPFPVAHCLDVNASATKLTHELAGTTGLPGTAE